jgi:hypothetical protein
MANSKTRVPVHRTKVKDYQSVAESFYRGAELAREFEYWNASGMANWLTAIGLVGSAPGPIIFGLVIVGYTLV